MLVGQIVDRVEVTGIAVVGSVEHGQDLLLQRFTAALGDVSQGRQAARLDARPGDALDLAQPAHLARRNEGDRFAGPTGPAGAPDAVDVRLRALWDIEIDDVGDVGDVEAARRHVGGDEHVSLTGAEAAHDAIALRLREIAMDRLHGVAAGHEGLSQFVDTRLGAAEDHRRLRRLRVENAREGVDTTSTRDLVGGLTDLGHGHLLAGDRDPLRLAQIARGEIDDARGHGGREEGSLAVDGGLRQDPLDVLDKAHVEHFIGLIEDEEAHIVKKERATAHVVHDPAGRTDDDLGPALQTSELPLVWLAAVDGQGLDVLVAPVAVDGFRHLDGQLPRRRQNQRLHGPLLRIDRLDDGQAKRGGLAGAGLSLCDDVPAGEKGRDGRGLNRRRLFVPDVFDGFQQGTVKPERFEGRRGLALNGNDDGRLGIDGAIGFSSGGFGHVELLNSDARSVWATAGAERAVSIMQLYPEWRLGAHE